MGKDWGSIQDEADRLFAEGKKAMEAGNYDRADALLERAESLTADRVKAMQDGELTDPMLDETRDIRTRALPSLQSIPKL